MAGTTSAGAGTTAERSTSSTAERYTTLTVEALAAALRALPGWHLAGAHLVRTVAPGDPWGLLERVQRIEDELDHHSTVTLDAGAVTFEVWTHVRSGLTAADVALAARISAAAEDV